MQLQHLKQTARPAAFYSDTYDWFRRKRWAHMEKYQYLEPLYDGDPVQGAVLWRKWEKISGPTNMLKKQQGIIQNYCDEMAALSAPRGTIVDLGCGTAALRNTAPLIESYKTIKRYNAVDLNAAYAGSCKKDIESLFPGINGLAVCHDFMTPSMPLSHRDDIAVLFMGGTIGNFEARPETPDAIDLMARQITHFAQNFPRGTIAFIGLEATQDRQLLYQDYIHPAHQEFEIAMMHGIKREVLFDQPGFDPDAWRYAMAWFPKSYQFCHIAQALEDQSFYMFDEKIEIRTGDNFVIDNSFKFPVEAMQEAVQKAGKEYLKAFSDEDGRMVIHAIRL